MEILKWVGAAVAVLGLLFLFFGLTWTEWPQIVIGVALSAVGWGIWRVFSGSWRLRASR